MRIMVHHEKFTNKNDAKMRISSIKPNCKPSEGTIEQIHKAIEQGRTIIPAVLSGTKADSWQSQELFMVDIDNDRKDAKEHLTPAKALKICKERGLMPVSYYHSFSSTQAKEKFRLLFIMDRIITDKAERELIQNTLIDIFSQSDKSCKNADRIFFGTNSKVQVINLKNRITLKAIKQAHGYVNFSKMSFDNSELGRLKQNFDLKNYMIQRNGEYKSIGSQNIMFKNCEICGHHDDLVYYGGTNSFHCFGANGGVGGNVIDYFMHTEGLDFTGAKEKLYNLYGKPLLSKPTLPKASDEVIL